jgi:hypothetical protein
MKLQRKISLAMAGLVLLAVAGVCGWLFAYTGDLPDFDQLSVRTEYSVCSLRYLSRQPFNVNSLRPYWQTIAGFPRHGRTREVTIRPNCMDADVQSLGKDVEAPLERISVALAHPKVSRNSNHSPFMRIEHTLAPEQRASMALPTILPQRP